VALGSRTREDRPVGTGGGIGVHCHVNSAKSRSRIGGGCVIGKEGGREGGGEGGVSIDQTTLTSHTRKDGPVGAGRGIGVHRHTNST